VHINSGVYGVGGIACNVRVISAVRYFYNDIAGGNEGVVDDGIITINGCIIGGVPNGDNSGLDIDGNNASALVVSLVDDGLCNGAAFAFVSSSPHVLWL
jgi:hypothetical protein